LVKYNLSKPLDYGQKLGSAVAAASSRKLLTVLFARLLEWFTLGFQESLEYNKLKVWKSVGLWIFVPSCNKMHRRGLWYSM